MYHLTQENSQDRWEVENLYDTAFGPGRTGLSSYRLRDGIDPVAELCFIARDDDGILAGCIRYWPVRVGGAPCLLLGPIAVHPTRQGEGLGARLLAHSLEVARKSGWDYVMLVGDLPYYEKFGFGRLDHVEMPPPTNPERVLGQTLTDNMDIHSGLSGLVEPWTPDPKVQDD